MLFYNEPLPRNHFYRVPRDMYIESAIKPERLQMGPALDEMLFDCISAIAGCKLNYSHLLPDDMMRLAASPFFAMSPDLISPSTTSPFK